MILDQYADKLDSDGRWGFVDKCWETFRGADHVKQVVLWALCGDDLKAINEEKLGGDANKEHVREWKKLGAAIEDEAKNDPGVASILKQVEAAKADWKAFEAKNHDAIVLYQKLKAGVRSSKSNDKNFDGCWELTQPPFAKAVRATKFNWDNEGDKALAGRIAELVASNPVNYYTAANFGMCAYSAHVTGGVLANYVFDADGVFGWRTMLIAKLLDPAFKPKFTDRSYSWNTGEYGVTRDILVGSDGMEDINAFPWPGGSLMLQIGVISKMKKDGDDTLVSFKGAVVDGCLSWVETRKIRTFDTSGDPVYERICKKRGKVEEDAPGDATFGTKLMDGFAPGMSVAFFGHFPVEVWNTKTKKFVAILGVSVKGSPAEIGKK